LCFAWACPAQTSRGIRVRFLFGSVARIIIGIHIRLVVIRIILTGQLLQVVVIVFGDLTCAVRNRRDIAVLVVRVRILGACAVFGCHANAQGTASACPPRPAAERRGQGIGRLHAQLRLGFVMRRFVTLRGLVFTLTIPCYTRFSSFLLDEC